MAKLFYIVNLLVWFVIFNDLIKALGFWKSVVIAFVCGITNPIGPVIFLFVRPFLLRSVKQQPVSLSFCPNCGSNVRQSARSCPKCGNSLAM